MGWKGGAQNQHSYGGGGGKGHSGGHHPRKGKGSSGGGGLSGPSGGGGGVGDASGSKVPKAQIQLNSQLCKAADTGGWDSLLDIVARRHSEMSIVNLTTALHKLARSAKDGTFQDSQNDPRFLVLREQTRIEIERHTNECEEAYPRCWATIAWSYATLQLRDAEALESLRQIGHLAVAHITSFKAIELTNLLWAFAKTQVCDPQLFQDAQMKILLDLQSFSQSNLATLVWAFVTAQQTACQGLLRHIGEQFVQGLAMTEQVNPTEIANFVWGLATAQLPLKSRMAQMTTVGDTATRALRQFKLQELSITAWGFSRLGVRHDAFFAAAAAELRSNLQLRHAIHPQGIANIFWAFAKQVELNSAVGNELRASLPFLIPSCSRLLSQLKPLEMSSSLWALTKLGIRGGQNPSTDELFSAATSVGEGFLRKLSLQSCINLLGAFSRFVAGYEEVSPPACINFQRTLARACFIHLGQLQPVSETAILEAVCDIRNPPNEIVSLSTSAASAATRDIGRFKKFGLERLAQVAERLDPSISGNLLLAVNKRMAELGVERGIAKGQVKGYRDGDDEFDHYDDNIGDFDDAPDNSQWAEEDNWGRNVPLPPRPQGGFAKQQHRGQMQPEMPGPRNMRQQYQNLPRQQMPPQQQQQLSPAKRWQGDPSMLPMPQGLQGPPPAGPCGGGGRRGPSGGPSPGPYQQGLNFNDDFEPRGNFSGGGGCGYAGRPGLPPQGNLNLGGYQDQRGPGPAMRGFQQKPPPDFHQMDNFGPGGGCFDQGGCGGFDYTQGPCGGPMDRGFEAPPPPGAGGRFGYDQGFDAPMGRGGYDPGFDASPLSAPLHMGPQRGGGYDPAFDGPPPMGLGPPLGGFERDHLDPPMRRGGHQLDPALGLGGGYDMGLEPPMNLGLQGGLDAYNDLDPDSPMGLHGGLKLPMHGRRHIGPGAQGGGGFMGGCSDLPPPRYGGGGFHQSDFQSMLGSMEPMPPPPSGPSMPSSMNSNMSSMPPQGRGGDLGGGPCGGPGAGGMLDNPGLPLNSAGNFWQGGSAGGGPGNGGSSSSLSRGGFGGNQFSRSGGPQDVLARAGAGGGGGCGGGGGSGLDGEPFYGNLQGSSPPPLWQNQPPPAPEQQSPASMMPNKRGQQQQQQQFVVKNTFVETSLSDEEETTNARLRAQAFASVPPRRPRDFTGDVSDDMDMEFLGDPYGLEGLPLPSPEDLQQLGNQRRRMLLDLEPFVPLNLPPPQKGGGGPPGSNPQGLLPPQSHPPAGPGGMPQPGGGLAQAMAQHQQPNLMAKHYARQSQQQQPPPLEEPRGGERRRAAAAAAGGYTLFQGPVPEDLSPAASTPANYVVKNTFVDDGNFTEMDASRISANTFRSVQPRRTCEAAFDDHRYIDAKNRLLADSGSEGEGEDLDKSKPAGSKQQFQSVGMDTALLGELGAAIVAEASQGQQGQRADPAVLSALSAAIAAETAKCGVRSDDRVARTAAAAAGRRAGPGQANLKDTLRQLDLPPNGSSPAARRIGVASRISPMGFRSAQPRRHCETIQEREEDNTEESEVPAEGTFQSVGSAGGGLEELDLGLMSTLEEQKEARRRLRANIFNSAPPRRNCEVDVTGPDAPAYVVPLGTRLKSSEAPAVRPSRAAAQAPPVPLQMKQNHSSDVAGYMQDAIAEINSTSEDEEREPSFLEKTTARAVARAAAAQQAAQAAAQGAPGPRGAGRGAKRPDDGEAASCSEPEDEDGHSAPTVRRREWKASGPQSSAPQEELGADAGYFRESLQI
eukprot:TRINITY_DN14876_c0_g1_i1.p1 TRINITY_DN14876_c0_g1~~TRINITY_DN14876_c0_g1_i1.p1  ORF type:complete len:1758 (-),score=412.23 TRINITY_DN14876_c0_g1_i1:180-5453(-)